MFTSESAAAINRARAVPLFDRCIPEPNTGCWLWEGGTWRGGYGCVGTGDGRMIGAHRRAWELSRGPIPAGMHVLHKCDNPLCINPEHLFLGTNQDNSDDKMAKGRGRWSPPLGSDHGMAILNENDVIVIRARAACGEAPSVIACAFGVGVNQVRKIIKRKAWRHVK